MAAYYGHWIVEGEAYVVDCTMDVLEVVVPVEAPYVTIYVPVEPMSLYVLWQQYPLFPVPSLPPLYPSAPVYPPATTINDLPQEVLSEIFSYISVEDLVLRVPMVCRRWQDACDAPAVWRNKFLTITSLHKGSEVLKWISRAPRLRYLRVLALEIFGPNVWYFLNRYGHLIVSLHLVLQEVHLLSVIGECCPRLTELILCGDSWPVEATEHFHAIKHLNSLQKFTAPGLLEFPWPGFVEYFGSPVFSTLTHLDVSYSRAVGRRVMKVICDNCQKLVYLNLMKCICIGDEALMPLFQLKELKYLNLKGCNSVSDEGIVHIVKCKDLEKMNLKQCNYLTTKAVRMCCQLLPKLCELHINEFPYSQEDLMHIRLPILK